MTPTFPANARTQAALYALMNRSGDVHIEDIFVTTGGDPARKEERDDRGRRYAQSWSSRYIQKLNRRLKPEGQIIVPGRLRHTYRLTSLQH